MRVRKRGDVAGVVLVEGQRESVLEAGAGAREMAKYVARKYGEGLCEGREGGEVWLRR